MLIKKGARGEKSVWECDICSRHFEIQNNRATEAIKLGQKRFCSKKCKSEHWKENASKRVIEWQKITNGKNFKGGIGITTDGYVYIRIKNNGYHNNQVKLHRYLMEVKLGRTLKSDEIVHHINFDKYDNRIENLQIVTRSEHNKIHKFLCERR